MSQEPERSNFPEIFALREQGLSFAEISERTGETREAIRQGIARSAPLKADLIAKSSEQVTL
jgi:lambda repressor-like predicted transcriptional regulator